MLLLYFLGSYIRKYSLDERFDKKSLLKILIATTALNVFLNSLISIATGGKPHITMRLVSMLTEENMFPGTATVSSVDPVQKRVETETRLQMVSQDQTWKIVFFQERIDFVYNYLGGSEYYTDLNVIFEKGINLINRTFNCFSETTGNRLAVNGSIKRKLIVKYLAIKPTQCYT